MSTSGPRSERAMAMTVVLLGVVGLGCGVAQRPSLKVVDPTLLADGDALERTRIKGGFELGSYRVREVGMRSESPDPDGPLASEDIARPVTQHRAGLVLDAPEGRSWTTSCRLQRRAPVVSDYRAVLDENGDEVAVDCTAKTHGRPPWQLRARALLSSNFVAQLGPEGGDAQTVEVLTRVTHMQRIERILPVPVAQLRQEDRAVVSVLMGRPERAWVAKGLDAETTEAALALLLTLRFLPWELAE